MTLPGHLHHVPEGATCDHHKDRPATRSVQGETDSFGYETSELCEECYTRYRENIKNADTSGTCSWCKNHAPRLSHRRDYDEGMYGPVYRVCAACVDEDNRRINEELSAMEPLNDYYGDYDD